MYLVVRGVGSVAERVAGVDSLFAIDSIPDKMRLSLAKHYQTRLGYPVTRMEFHTSSLETGDGFPWRVTYRLPDGSEDYGWYNDEGRWTNNLWWFTEVDLVEVAE